MIFIGETDTGDRVEYHDTKRYLWILSLVLPLTPIVGIWLFLAFDEQTLFLLFPLIFGYIIIPILDFLVGEDHSNPPAEVVDQMSGDNYYRILLHISVPLFWIGYIVPVWLVASYDLPIWSVLALAFNVGQINGTALTVGHELGHKQSRFDRFMAKLACAISGYGHFCIEHNRGHHTHVATPEDCASARYNETIYHFLLREIPGALVRGWSLETKRLKQRGLNWWHWRNDILQGYAITAVVSGVLIYLFGLQILPFMLIASFSGWYALTQANYVEHYGLKRLKMKNGRYEPCAPHHSWNTNHTVSNLMLFHLQRHSDHHANPLRPYQALRNFDDLPRLPSGYPGSFMLAAIPPLWFRVMNPKVLEWAGGDMEKVNTG